MRTDEKNEHDRNQPPDLDSFPSPRWEERESQIVFPSSRRGRGFYPSFPLPAWERIKEKGQYCCRNFRYGSYAAGISREEIVRNERLK